MLMKLQLMLLFITESSIRSIMVVVLRIAADVLNLVEPAKLP